MINVSKKTIKLSCILLFITSLLITFSLGFGEVMVNPLDVLKSIVGIDTGFSSVLVMNIRLPRVLVAFFVGASLALAGSILQGVVKNPLASPDILGIVNGGSVGALVFLTIFTDPKNNSLTTSILYMPIFTFAFSFLALLVIFFIYGKSTSTSKLIIIGIGVSAICKALTNILIINGPVIFIKEATTWITGTIYGSNWNHVIMITSTFFVFAIIAVIFIKDLNLHQLDDDVVTVLGNNLRKSRLILLCISAGLTAGAVTIGGGIGFVGLIAPHISRKLVDSKFENLIPLSILIGGIITLVADFASKWLFYPQDLPIGIFTASIGAPYFIYLLIKNRKYSKGR
ncbi:ferrichrome transport system permease FhuG [[Clostridium] sordellii]|uniref:Ferrichrome transport system permease protein n=1 Tax=Paraclostridium sordellii TaxID=1505 RepID=A0ABP1XWF4_PARSO|nr:iron ABC transporter permease [Paeniclostridium sordellii]TAN65951.1 iron ABC transporter permease [Paeniclostridium sordellii 8483]CEJ73679.1 ferrichrome transport system permease protein [[Clostridium] sordellii] [Paeniclostridium sordellii]CEN69227.1 ferrichrome transport system permease FhuG [[Clostridium] sordellii] [Paeniclostridium sordellii]CEN72495.1 ferrichrome transport system permease FhuG [[Clostridium] sordellii] [Paeniclostridium sordellii]CEO24001.1 ferrichrome transport sys